MSKFRHPSKALLKIIPKPEPKKIWNRETPTSLEYTVSLINSSPLVLFSRPTRDEHARIHTILQNAHLPYLLVDLDKMPPKLGSTVQRRLRDLTDQWTVPHLFAKSQSIGGIQCALRALDCGKVHHILQSPEWLKLVYCVRPDECVRHAEIKQKSPMSFAMAVQDSHNFSYVHKERWAKVKSYWGELPALEGVPSQDRFLERPKLPKGWKW